MFHQLYSLCTATKDMKFTAALTKKKKGGWGSDVLSLCASVQSMFDMAQSDEPESKRARFSKVDGDFLAKIREELVPAATKRTTSSWVNVFNDRTSSRPTCRTKVHFSVLPVGRNISQPISVVGCPTGWTLCSSMVHSIAMQRNMVAGSGSI